MAYQEALSDRQGGSIELIRCITPTPEERNNPGYVPQLEINKKAQEIISERFNAPISIIVYVGNMGVGKSKLASLTIAALEKGQHDPSLGWFRSGVNPDGITRGVWMWCEPLYHPDDHENKKGSILVLDCEGMGDLDETTGANLYLFCMIMSTAFCVLLRPARIEKDQCERLYHALRRFENMRTQHVLPNFWLMPLDSSEFAYSDVDIGDDVIITKEQWIERVFSVNEERNHLSTIENQRLKTQYEFIHRILPKIDAINIDHLPRSLMKNTQTLDLYLLLREKEVCQYFESIQTAIRALLASGGKRLPGSTTDKMFVRPVELASFMGELIEVINGDKLPNPDSLIGRYLTDRFINGVEKECLARFKNDLLYYTKEVLCKELGELQRPQTETEMSNIYEAMKKKHADTVQYFFDIIINRVRYEILGLDESLRAEFNDEKQRQKSLDQIPVFLRHRLTLIEAQMNDYQEPIMLIERALHNLTIADFRRREEENKTLLEQTLNKFQEMNHSAVHESKINQSLTEENLWRVGVAPCSCGARGGAYNMLHVNCQSKNRGNLYYLSGAKDKMVCDECRQTVKCSTYDARCTRCSERIKVTRIY
ncbi:unnamed protein product [Rotaria sp. Silwood1]|nr:unnamed protein product [Rotaria sp. Silwood1]CAF3683598.1 unnamed protein product [Rotaria sp. Silwood1]CAF3747239.1 unnamed protein product [Rotaria sp. Silwood1]CAF3754441.1 unnamed protein product [Rotaria sp. Silwood1]CAF3801470.1 unnamed protein product [Rotaria sp. Silwood1]